MTSNISGRLNVDTFHNLEIASVLLTFCSLSDLGKVAGTSKRFYGIVKGIISECILPDFKKLSGLISRRITDLGAGSLSDYKKHIESSLSEREPRNLGEMALLVIDIKSQFIKTLAREPQPSNLSQVITAPAHFSEVFRKTEEYMSARNKSIESVFSVDEPIMPGILYFSIIQRGNSIGNLMEKKLFCYRILEVISKIEDLEVRECMFPGIAEIMCKSENLYGALELANSISRPDPKAQAFLKIGKEMFEARAKDSAMKALDLAVEAALGIEDRVSKSELLFKIANAMVPPDVKVTTLEICQKALEVLDKALEAANEIENERARLDRSGCIERFQEDISNLLNEIEQQATKTSEEASVVAGIGERGWKI